MKITASRLFLAFVWVLLFSANTFGQNCVPIESLPFTVNAPGSYCLARDLFTDAATGNAITINASNVVLDLTGHRLSGSGRSTTRAIGIYGSEDHRNITVKNGMVSGFMTGVFIDDGDVPFLSREHAVEGIRAYSNTLAGIEVIGRDSIIRNNEVVDTGGTNSSNSAFGIILGGANGRVINNDVLGTVARRDGTANSIEVVGSDGSVVENNRIGSTFRGSGASIGINIIGPSANVLAIENKITNLPRGIVFSSGSGGKFRDNLTSGVSTPFTGGTDAGNNQ